MLLLLSGLIAISSLTAATMIQKAGWDRNSTVNRADVLPVYSRAAQPYSTVEMFPGDHP
jgi:hypothetical protein